MDFSIYIYIVGPSDLGSDDTQDLVKPRDGTKQSLIISGNVTKFTGK